MSPSSAPSDDTRPSILLVDDNAVFRRQLERAFARRGFDVRTAANGDEAVASALEDSPELAVLDLRMPGQDGLELLQQLKRIDPSTRVVMLTGYGSIATTVDAMRLGAENYLPKPADVDDILAAFERGSRAPLEGSPRTYEAPSLARVEWEHIHRVLADCSNNISEAARRLRIHRRTLQRKLRQYAPP